MRSERVDNQKSRASGICLFGIVCGLLAFALFAIVMGGIGLATGQDQVTYVAIATMAFLIPLGAGSCARGPSIRSSRSISSHLQSSSRRRFAPSAFPVVGRSGRFHHDGHQLRKRAEQRSADYRRDRRADTWLCGHSGSFPDREARGDTQLRIDQRRVWVAVLLASTVAAVGLALLINSFGVDFPSGFGTQSMKRVHEYVGEDGSIVYGSGSERFLAGMASAVLLLGSLMVLKLLPANLHNLAFHEGVAFMAILGPFLTSSRSIVLLIIHLAIFLFYYGELKVRTVLIGGAAAIFILVTLGVIRETNQTDVERDMTAIDRVVGSGNSLDFVRTSAIIDRVPETSPYTAGDSYGAARRTDPAFPSPARQAADRPWPIRQERGFRRGRAGRGLAIGSGGRRMDELWLAGADPAPLPVRRAASDSLRNVPAASGCVVSRDPAVFRDLAAWLRNDRPEFARHNPDAVLPRSDAGSAADRPRPAPRTARPAYG